MVARRPLSRDDWIRSAQKVLVKSGVESVRVDNLARDFGITRGSFYYHFSGRSDLLEAVLSNWRGRATESVINSLQQANVPPKEQLLHLMELPLHGEAARHAAAIELAIRAWARRDQRARAAIDEVDNYRLKYIESLLEKLGMGEDTEDLAFLVYSYQLTASMVSPNGTKAEPQTRHQRICELLLRKKDSGSS